MTSEGKIFTVDYSSTLRIDENLLDRIRSLLLSRNGHCPPKTPHSSPQFASQSQDVNNTVGFLDPNINAHNLEVDNIIAKLAQSATDRHAMVVNEFDRSAGLFGDTLMDGHRRHPSQSNLYRSLHSGSDDTSIPLDTTLNQKALGITMGRDLLNRSGAQTDTRKLAYGTRIPRYVLRTVTPSTAEKTNQIFRPAPQHVPGSYISEVEQIMSPRTPLLSPLDNHQYFGNGDGILSAKKHTHTGLDPPVEATNALHDIKDHNSPPMTSQLNQSDALGHTSRLLISKTSISSFGSHVSVKRPRHPLLQLSGEPMSVGHLAEPLLTSTLEHGTPYDTSQLKAQEAAVLHSSDKKSTQSHNPAPPLNPNNDTRSLKGLEPVRHDSHLDSKCIAKLLTDITPFGGNMNRAEAQPSDVAASRFQPRIRQKPGSFSPSIYSRRSSLRFRSSDNSRRSSLSPMRPKVSDEPSYEPENAISIRCSSRTSSEMDTTSFGRKPSSFKRALPHLSDHSLQPVRGTLSTESLLKHNLNDPENEAACLQKSPSMLFTDNSGSRNEIVGSSGSRDRSDIWQVEAHLATNKFMATKRDDLIEAKNHWIKQLLGRRSSLTRSHQLSQNLTARSHFGQKLAMRDLALRERANTVPWTEKHIATGDGSRSDRRATNSVDVVFGQRSQQNADSFSKIIGELESLLKEALNIAHQAAEKEEEPRACDHLEHVSSDPPNDGGNSIDNTSGISATEESQDMDHHIDARPFPSDSVTEKRYASLAPGRETTLSTSEHAKHVAAQLKIPFPGLKMEFLPFERVPESQKRDLRESTEIVPQSIPSEVLADFADRSFDSNLSSPRLFRPYPEATVQPLPQKPNSSKQLLKEQHIHVQRNTMIADIPSREDVRDFINVDHELPFQPQSNSVRLRMKVVRAESAYHPNIEELNSSEEDMEGDTYIADFRQPGDRTRGQTRQWIGSVPQERPGLGPGSLPQQDTITSLRAPPSVENVSGGNQEVSQNVKGYSLRDRHHFSIRGPQGFSLSRSHRRAPIARDWSTRRKRFVATVTCINTALIGLIIGIYAGEVPAIQYAIVDENHYAILGNVVFFIGMAVTTVLFFPLPLLHGRKPYTIAALGILLPLQFPQAIAVGQTDSPYVANYRVGLLLSRSFAGILAGFINMNLKTTLLDLFGASLQSGNPHQETVNENDVRRHGGGMGVWLGIWTWCSIGSIGIGFLIGAVIISGLPVTWGFWITIIMTAAVLLLNVMTPEVRRSPYRRSMAEVDNGTDVSRRIARGEIKMHLYSTGPRRWWEEVIAGHVLCIKMLKQPGFLILSFYMGWIYGQVIMVIVLLGALTSKYYFFLPQYVGLCVSAIPFGALLAIPFQKASLFSRARHHAPRTDSMTFEKRVTWTSHLIRRALFMILLPFAGLAYTLASGGPHTHFMVPTIFAALIGFLSNLAIAECNGIIMETYDTSDLQPGMTGRPRHVLPEDIRRKRTNFSCFPRVTAAFAINQTFAFLIAAAATGTGGVVERALGAQAATGVVAGVLLVLTLLLIVALTRFKTVQIVPSRRYGTNVLGGPEDEWKPVIIGHPSGTTRRLSLLEMGALTRWSEIRRKNRLMEG